jgi:hypothetical protein
VKRLNVIAPALVLAAALPAAASAHEHATPTQRRAILTAVVRQQELSQAQAACQVVTVSTVSRNYATVSWPQRLSSACEKVAADGVIIEKLHQGSWHFVTVGSGFSCPIKGVPDAVSRDLGVCPSHN